ncbi:hypothetical protein ACN42_g8120 [Penicillium freii]|uniref:Uncharacterized protein n=1 Tax=Penicillium freii TaxID=48697 RepID=A0A101MEC0_PENFR|nr:hypothetical protein ACN42_g8120 [Penicillium freii]
MFMVRAVGKSRSADQFIDKLGFCLCVYAWHRIGTSCFFSFLFFFFFFNLPWKLLDSVARRALLIPYYMYVYGVNINLGDGEKATTVRGFLREDRGLFTCS